MGRRLTEQEQAEYQKIMADPAASAKYRLLIGGLLDDFDAADAEQKQREQQEKPKTFFEEIDALLFGRG